MASETRARDWVKTRLRSDSVATRSASGRETPALAIEASTRQVQQSNAVALMVFLADDAADRLCARLEDARPELRDVVRVGVYHLVASGHGPVTACVQAGLRDTSRRAAFTGLLVPLFAGGRVDAKEGFALLTELGRDPSSAVRQDAARAAPMFEPWSPPDMGEDGGAAGWMPEWRGRASRGSSG